MSVSIVHVGRLREEKRRVRCQSSVTRRSVAAGRLSTKQRGRHAVARSRSVPLGPALPGRGAALRRRDWLAETRQKNISYSGVRQARATENA